MAVLEKVVALVQARIHSPVLARCILHHLLPAGEVLAEAGPVVVAEVDQAAVAQAGRSARGRTHSPVLARYTPRRPVQGPAEPLVVRWAAALEACLAVAGVADSAEEVVVEVYRYSNTVSH